MSRRRPAEPDPRGEAPAARRWRWPRLPRPPWRRLALITGLEAGLLLSLYALARSRVAEGDLVSRLLAAGSATGPSDLALAVAFLGLRLAVLIGLPCFLVYRGTRVTLLALRASEASGANGARGDRGDLGARGDP